MGQTVNLLAYAFGGSNPSLPTKAAEVAQLIEHQPSKLRVASLSLVFRSKAKGPDRISIGTFYLSFPQCDTYLLFPFVLFFPLLRVDNCMQGIDYKSFFRRLISAFSLFSHLSYVDSVKSMVRESCFWVRSFCRVTISALR